MKKNLFVVGILLVCMLYALPAWSADARQEAYLKAVQDFVVHHKFPDGEVLDEDVIIRDFGFNKIAIADINNDGKPELLLQFITSEIEIACEYLCGFDEKTSKLTVEFVGYPRMEYFNNGCIKQYILFKRGLANNTFWPYGFVTYNSKKKEYEKTNDVSAWNKNQYPVDPREKKPFPDKIDVTGDGFVYFISDDNFKLAKGPDEAVDTPVYEAWVKKYIGGAEQIKVEWFPANVKGIKMFKDKLAGLPVQHPSWSADEIYGIMLKAAYNYVLKHELPAKDESSNDENIGDISKNTLAIYDIDGDGKSELLIRNMTEKSESIYDFSESIEKIFLKYRDNISLEYFNNDYIKYIDFDEECKLSGTTFPSFHFVMYNKRDDSFDREGSVVIWSKDASPTNPDDENKPFPNDIDKTGDGFVYFISDNDFADASGFEKAVDTPVYEAWVKNYVGNAKPIKVQWVPATEDGIKILEAKRHE